jgi:hypothetical protein
MEKEAARRLHLFFHTHFSLFSRESFVRCARKKKRGTIQKKRRPNRKLSGERRPRRTEGAQLGGDVAATADPDTERMRWSGVGVGSKVEAEQESRAHPRKKKR